MTYSQYNIISIIIKQCPYSDKDLYTGLGLPISRRLVEIHGGRLWAESTGILGEGSIFFVELPIETCITEVIKAQEN